MNRRKIIVSALLALLLCGLLLVQRQTIKGFAEHTPRLEIALPAGTSDSAAAILERYAPEAAAEGLVIYAPGRPADIFLKDEVSDLLAGGGISQASIYDGTQSLRLARQALELSLFAVGLCAAVLCVRLVWRGARDFAGFFREQLKLGYPREIVRDNLERVLASLIAGAVLVVAFALLTRELVAFTPFVPPHIVPATHILDVGHYINVLRSAPAPETAYAALCRGTLSALYVQTACAAVLSLGLLASLWREGKKGDYHEETAV